MTLYVPVPCWPEIRLRWDMVFSPRFAHILDLQQNRFEDAPQFQFLQVCTLVIPAYCTKKDWSDLSLRKEDQINQLNLDRIFLFFVQAGRGSILPQMLKLSKDWCG